MCARRPSKNPAENGITRGDSQPRACAGLSDTLPALAQPALRTCNRSGVEAGGFAANLFVPRRVLMNPIVIIPARMAATRLPGKPLADIEGVAMIVRVLRC